MDPHGQTTPGLHLPQPSPVQPHQQSPVQHPVSQSGLPHGVTAGQATSPTPQPPLPVTAPQQPQLYPTADSVVPPAAVPDDVADDHQDEEWINKAKEIVDRNRMDPYNQSRELGELKAQYLKARYNKDIKTGKDQA